MKSKIWIKIYIYIYIMYLYLKGISKITCWHYEIGGITGHIICIIRNEVEQIIISYIGVIYFKMYKGGTRDNQCYL